MRDKASGRRALVASLIGSSIEFYDFYIYGTAASILFGALFFPSTSPAAQLMLSYASFSVAFLARPLGAFVFGHFGDRLGRKTIFIASLLVMGCSTVGIGLLPTYAALGWIATLMLCLLRFGQGIGLGGLWSGATLLAVESAPATHRGRYGMVPQLGYPLGFVAANGIFLLLGVWLDDDAFRSWGWRLPFLASLVLIGLGLWTRFRLEEPAEYAAAAQVRRPQGVPIVELLTSFPRQTLGATFAIVGSVTSYYLSSVFSLGYGTMELGYSRQEFLELLLFAIPFFALGIVISGFLADRLPITSLLVFSSLSLVGVAFLLQYLMVAGSPMKVWSYLALSFFFNGMGIGPFGTWMASQFPTRVRFTGTALCYNVGSIIGAGFAPVIAQSLVQMGGLRDVGYYLSAAALISCIAFLYGRAADEGELVVQEA